MKKIILAFFILSLFACQPTKNMNTEGYIKLEMDAELEKYVGKMVYFKAKKCKMEMQHMLRGSMNGSNRYICIDRVNEKGEMIGQMLAYTEMIEAEDDKIFTVFGRLDVISGAGKGGGTHTEYYLELDKVE